METPAGISGLGLQPHLAKAPLAKIAGAFNEAGINHCHQARGGNRWIEAYAKASVMFRHVADDPGGLAPLWTHSRENNSIEIHRGDRGWKLHLFPGEFAVDAPPSFVWRPQIGKPTIDHLQ